MSVHINNHCYFKIILVKVVLCSISLNITQLLIEGAVELLQLLMQVTFDLM